MFASLIDLFSAPDAPLSRSRARSALLTYYSLLHYSNISHAHLTALLRTPRQPYPPSRAHAVSLVLRQLLAMMLHPRFIAFLPPCLVHIPTYALAGLAKRALASPREEETHAQYKAIFGMVGAGATYGALGALLARTMDHLPILEKIRKATADSDGSLKVVLEIVGRLGSWIALNGGVWRDGVVLVGCIYVTAKVLSKWHNALVGGKCVPSLLVHR